MRNILLSAATVLLAGSTLVGSAHSAELPKGAAHNIVLVHGAFVDQTSWQPVADILTKKGYNVTLVENPLTSLAADVDATKQALAKQDGRTVLVGHSWGGDGHHASRRRSQGFGAGLCLRVRARRRRVSGVAVQEPARRPKAATRFIPTTRATSTSTRRCFLPRSRLTFRRRSPRTWLTRSFR